MGLYKVESQFRVVEAEVKSGGREQGSRRKGFALVILCLYVQSQNKQVS